MSSATRSSGLICSIESLEARTFLASDTLLIRGTNAADIITLDIRSDGAGGKFARVTTNTGVRNFDLAGVQHIRIESLGGDDLIVVRDRVVRGIEINASLGNDTITGGSGADTIIGGRGNDQIDGGDGVDRLRGDADSDTVAGGNGSDRIDGGDGNDFITGGNGNDTITGGAGLDSLFGQQGNDVFFSRDGEIDQVAGGAGSNSADADGIDQLSSIQNNFT